MTKLILDPASGSRMFYFDKQDRRVLFGDIRELDTTLIDGRALKVSPDQLMDFRALPFADKSFQLVIFDPPHFKNLGETSWMAQKYGVLNKDTWQDDIKQGFSECFRVLKTNGVLVFKWNELQIPVKDILRLTDQIPVIGHKSGKLSKTHWLLFLKN